jgi:hypothetical protein
MMTSRISLTGFAPVMVRRSRDGLPELTASTSSY